METLKQKIYDAQEAGDIAGLYVLESQAHEKLDEETLIAYYANILELALENLTSSLENARKLNINEVQDFATLRALYEYAVEHYSAQKLNDAAALFEILAGLSDDISFSSAMKVHLLSANKGVSLEDFINKIADIDATQAAGTFYISTFKERAE